MDACHGYVRRAPVVALAVLTLTVSIPVLAAGGSPAPTATPRHESPKSPTGHEGTTRVIALVALVLVSIGIAAGTMMETHGLPAPPHPTDTGERTGPYDTPHPSPPPG